MAASSWMESITERRNSTVCPARETDNGVFSMSVTLRVHQSRYWSWHQALDNLVFVASPVV